MFKNGIWLKMAQTCTCVLTTTHILTQFTLTFDPLEEPTSLKEERGPNFDKFLLLFSSSVRFLVVAVIVYGFLNPSLSPLSLSLSFSIVR